MIPDAEFNNTVAALHRNYLRLSARSKALESLIYDRLPDAERGAWRKLLDEQANRLFQLSLEEVEKKSPAFAASLDNRESQEMDGVETPLPEEPETPPEGIV